VLVVTSLKDVTADLVITALNRRGVPVVRADSADIASADIATSLTFAARIGTDGSGPERTGQLAKQWAGSLRTGTRRLDLQAVVPSTIDGRARGCGTSSSCRTRH
jgi:hypothetical protein